MRFSPVNMLYVDSIKFYYMFISLKTKNAFEQFTLGDKYEYAKLDQ